MVDALRIAIAGNIGVGKTTLVQAATSDKYKNLFQSLIQQEGAIPRVIRSYQEEFDSQLFEKYCAEPEKYALAFQLKILLASAKLEDHISETGGIALIDRSFYEHRHVFGQAQHQLGRIDEYNFEVYDAVYQELARRVPKPDVYIRLQADVETLQQHIKARGRTQEQWMVQEGSYLTTLNQLYDQFFKDIVQEPVIDINAADINLTKSNGLDHRNFQRTLQEITDKIRELKLPKLE